MRSRQFARDARRVRRWIGAVLCLPTLGVAALVIPRLTHRSPMAIVLLCVLAVLTMKLVEHGVRRWFDRWADRQAARAAPPEGRTHSGRR